MRSIDLTGQTFGRWKVIRRAENTKQGQAQWLCQCECGNQKVLKSIIIRRGISRSCGCLQSETTAARSTKHGHSSSQVISPTYHTWTGMMARCSNPKNKRYERYGGRGIKVCERWHDFRNFLADMGEKPNGASLDRYPDANGDYEPGNCRWATATEQARNRSNNRLVTINGKTKTAAEWIGRTGISLSTVDDRLKAGWTLEDAFLTPPGIATDNAKSRMLTLNGETMCVADWSRRLGIPRGRIYQRLHRGATDPEALKI